MSINPNLPFFWYYYNQTNVPNILDNFEIMKNIPNVQADINTALNQVVTMMYNPTTATQNNITSVFVDGLAGLIYQQFRNEHICYVDVDRWHDEFMSALKAWFVQTYKLWNAYLRDLEQNYNRDKEWYEAEKHKTTENVKTDTADQSYSESESKDDSASQEKARSDTASNEYTNNSTQGSSEQHSDTVQNILFSDTPQANLPQTTPPTYNYLTSTTYTTESVDSNEQHQDYSEGSTANAEKTQSDGQSASKSLHEDKSSSQSAGKSVSDRENNFDSGTEHLSYDFNPVKKLRYEIEMYKDFNPLDILFSSLMVYFFAMDGGFEFE